ncbi:molybdenum cofactor biosynthesis protein [Stereum hirsutum FP-91666 SS1]|uniref:molybdenum cofactor biosynthesis protein n=1 Tax=Stereum hirsutum (strain FP-91666) TaxID=721885 RepID=UPI000444A912|nr:molybdenum cofactor biosynthesis protein [Stereum hirsutum FP-91666 SS1]EIM85648.1 molybdenum cofactor biosynthesis protein [Stereum hirsutum FP-91666 SS1]
MSKLQAAVLTVSDTASKDASADRSGPSVRDILTTNGYEVKFHGIVPDDEETIRKVVLEWTAPGNGVDLILTTGGTGFGVRDRTPEAIGPLLQRQAPGLVHLVLDASLKHTALAALSRPIAGTINNTLILTLPGSVKAVNENMEALLAGGVLAHAVELIRGGSGGSTHNALQGSEHTISSSHSHSHNHLHHHHDHHHHSSGHDVPKPRYILSHDPSLPPPARHRVSPYPLFSPNEAVGTIFREIRTLSTEKKQVTPALKGHVLAEDVYAPQDIPFMHTTSADGYAIRSSDKPGIYKVVTSSTHKLSDVLPEGTIYRINTGGPLPAGTDTVIMVEDTRLVSSMKDEDGEDLEEAEVETLVEIPVGENVRAPGSDVRKGDLALQKGQIIHGTGGEIGTLVFVGRKEVEVYRKPIVAILSTGNELLDIQNPVSLTKADGWGGIWDTNRPSLHAALEASGYEVLDLGIAADTIEAHVEIIKQGLNHADVIITTGGTSMGASDLLKPVIERTLNGTIHFGRVKVKPGKPTTFATIPMEDNPELKKPLFALPGNPASALVMFHIFVLPALRRLAGWPVTACQLPRVQVRINEAMKLDPRLELHRAILRAEKDGITAYSTGGQRSSRVASLCGANGLVILPAKVEGGPEQIDAGGTADAFLIGEVHIATPPGS